MNQPAQIIAHRGASGMAPENTLPAFQLAEQLGADGIETDIHLTKDQIPVLIHDPSLERTTDGRGLVKDFTFRELRHLDAGKWFSNRYQHTPIMSLEQFMEWVKPRKLTVHLELKNNKYAYHYLEELVYEQIEHFKIEERVTLSTFNAQSLQRMASFNKSIPLALLRSRGKRNLAHYTEEMGASALHINYRLLNKNLVDQCRGLNLKLRVFTVNKYEHIYRCLQHHCHGMITDQPGKALYYRDSFQLRGLF